MEGFYEQFQTKDYTKVEKIFNCIIIILVIIIVLLLITLNFIIVTPFALLYLGVILLQHNIIVEYEYELTGYELSICKIMKKSRRKEIASFNIKEISSIRDVDKVGKDIKIKKAYLKNTENKPMVYLFNSSAGVIGYELSADEKLINLIKKVNPLAFY